MANTWNVTKVFPSPIQRRVKITHDSPDATPVTDYREADKLARQTLTAPVLATKGYDLSGRAYRVYVSQAY